MIPFIKFRFKARFCAVVRMFRQEILGDLLLEYRRWCRTLQKKGVVCCESFLWVGGGWYESVLQVQRIYHNVLLLMTLLQKFLMCIIQ